jgi:hypothetical protein
VFWAVVLIVVGAVFLLRNAGILTVGWEVIWPVLLIALGAWLLLGNFVRRGAATTSNSIPLDGAREAHIAVQHGAGELRIGPSSDRLTLVSHEVDGELDQRIRREGDRLDVRLRQDRDWTFWMWPGNWGSTNRWSMAINRDVPLTMAVQTGASDAKIDLRELKVIDLKVEIGASALDLTLPAAGSVSARIKAGAADVKVRVPEGVAARIRGVVGIGSLSVDEARFPRRGDGHQSAGYDAAAHRIDLDVEGGAASIRVM